MINHRVISILEDAGIDVDSAVLYLLAIYHNLKTNIIPEDIVRKVNLLKIVERDYTNTNNLIWNINLFEGQSTDDNWGWIDEFITLFNNVNPERRGVKKYVVERMKKFFAENPEVRKDDVLNATKLYIKNLTSPTYCMKSHKFIFDGVGAMKNSTLLQYVEIVKKKPNNKPNPNHKVIK